MKTRFESFSGRLTRRIIVVMLLIMTIVSGLVFFFATGSTLSLINGHYQDVLKLTDERVDGVLKVVEVTAANNVDEIQQHLSTPELVQKTLADELRLNPHIVGCGVGFIPDYFDKQGRWFEPYASREDDGSIRVSLIGSENHDYLQSEWYMKGLEAEHGYWTDPYFDEAGAREMLCTYALPIKDAAGRIVGVFGSDVALTWLTEQLQGFSLGASDFGLKESAVDKERPPYSFILGRTGNYLAHPDSTRILNENYFNHAGAKDTDTYERIGREMLAGKSGEQVTHMDGIKSYVYYAPLPTAWSMGIVVPVRSVLYPGLVLGQFILFLLACGLSLAFFLCRRSIRSTTRPLQQLACSAEEVAQGNFEAPLPAIKYNDEIRQLRDSFDDMQHSLTNYIGELTAATEERVSMERELGIAREIQMSMLPKDYPAFPDRKDIDILGQLLPAKAVGGDLYDFFIRDNALYFCIGDVSGKGVPASLVMSATATQFRALGATETHPDRILTLLNEALSVRNESIMFVTVFVGILHLDTGVLDYCNAGHDAPLLIGGDGSVQLLDVLPNLALGVISGQKYVPQRAKLDPGSMLFLYTDGLTEAENSLHMLFGLDRILDAARQIGPVSPEEFLAGMHAAAHRFVAGAEQSDDLTMLSIKRL